MDDDHLDSQENSSIIKLDIKQRITQAKIKAAEKRAAEIAAKQADQAVFAATPSPTPFSTSPFIESSTPSTANYASQPGFPFLRSPATNTERIQRANSLKALSKKIDGAGNFKLQELITRMILRCPGAKEVAESFFVLNDVENHVQSNNRELDDGDEDYVGRHRHEGKSISHVISTQSCTPSYSPESRETEHPTNSQTILTSDRNFQLDYVRSTQGRSEALSSSTRVTKEIVDTPTNNPTAADVSCSEISKALDNLLNGKPKSCETSNHDNHSKATPGIAMPEVNDNDTTSSSNMLQLASDISAKYLALARAFGTSNLPYDRIASLRTSAPPNNPPMDFSFEAFNSLVDSVRKNIERMQRADKTNPVSESSENSVVRENSSDLGSPIPIDATGQEWGRNPGPRDDTSPMVQETMARPVSSSSEEDEYADIVNITSSHYNCESCRKPIVLPEGFVVSLESPAPTTCLHCQTRKASGIIRRRLGVRARSDNDTEVPAKRKDGESLPGQVRYDATGLSHTPTPVPEIVSSRLEPPTYSLSELSREPRPTSSVEHLQQSTTLEQADDNLVKTHAGTDRHGGNAKNEHLGDTIVVETPARDVSASQIQNDGQSLSRKHKAKNLEDEDFYSFPIGPKRRRGRPLKNWGAAVSDASPTSSPQPSTPMTNSSSQDTSTAKKRGRPLGSKNRSNLEEFPSNIPAGERLSARKSREITQSLLTAELDSMHDITFESVSSIQTPKLSRRKKKSKFRRSQANATCGVFVPNAKAQKDSDSEYEPPQESDVRDGNGSMNIATSNSVLTSSSLDNIVSSETWAEKLGSGVIGGRDSRIPRAPNSTFTVDEQLRQSIEEQEERMKNRGISGKITNSQREGRMEREVGSFMGSTSDTISKSFIERNNSIGCSNRIGHNSNMLSGKQGQEKEGLVAHGLVSNQYQPHRESYCLLKRKAFLTEF